MKRIALAAVLLVMLVGPAWVGFDEGLAAYNRGDYETALKEFRPLADQGDVQAQWVLGNMYRIGQGVPQNDAEAVKWYRMAAELGYVPGQVMLGAMYQFGRGVPQDVVQTLMWLNIAAAQGDDGGKDGGAALAKLMTPADVSKAQAMAREWMEKHRE